MKHSFGEFMSLFAHKRGHGVGGTLLIYRQYRLPRLRHDEPFAKRRAGRLRRDERHFILRSKSDHLHV